MVGSPSPGLLPNLFASQLNVRNNQFPTRLLTPSTPNPKPGHPNPRAIVVGKAKGKDAAEKYDMDKVGIVGSIAGFTRISVDRDTFSGIARKDGMAYLREAC